MSMLNMQIKGLREAARNIQGKLGRCRYRRKDVDEMQQVSGMLFEAANTIESLRDRLQAVSETSDGYHTFNELYHHRAVLFSVVVAANSGNAWKSRLHHDGTMYDGMFIVGVDTPQGQATYHYDVEPYWDMFWCRELERAPEWDGHTSDEAIERIGSLRDAVLNGPRGRW